MKLLSLVFMNIMIGLSSTSNLHENVLEFQITFAGTELVYNDHVGNEWVQYSVINGQKLFQNDKTRIKISEGESLKIESFLYETNEKHIDYSMEVANVSYSELKKYKNSGFYVLLTITESNGRYAGNSAQFKFKYYVD